MKTISERFEILDSLNLFPTVLNSIICAYLESCDLELAKKIYAKISSESKLKINYSFYQNDMDRMYKILFLCVKALASEQPFDCKAADNILENMDRKLNKELDPNPKKMLERVLIREFATMPSSDNHEYEANLVTYRRNLWIKKPTGFNKNIDLCLILIGFRLVMIDGCVIDSIEQQNKGEGYTPPASKWCSQSLQFFLKKHSPKTRATLYDKCFNKYLFALFPSEAKLLQSTSEKVHVSELKSSIEEVLKGYLHLLPKYNPAPGLLSELGPTISQPVRIINKLLEQVTKCSSFQAIKSLLEEDKFKAIDQRCFEHIKDLIERYPEKPMWVGLTKCTKTDLSPQLSI